MRTLLKSTPLQAMVVMAELIGSTKVGVSPASMYRLTRIDGVRPVELFQLVVEAVATPVKRVVLRQVSGTLGVVEGRRLLEGFAVVEKPSSSTGADAPATDHRKKIVDAHDSVAVEIGRAVTGAGAPAVMTIRSSTFTCPFPSGSGHDSADEMVPKVARSSPAVASRLVDFMLHSLRCVLTILTRNSSIAFKMRFFRQ